MAQQEQSSVHSAHTQALCSYFCCMCVQKKTVCINTNGILISLLIVSILFVFYQPESENRCVWWMCFQFSLAPVSFQLLNLVFFFSLFLICNKCGSLWDPVRNKFTKVSESLSQSLKQPFRTFLIHLAFSYLRAHYHCAYVLYMSSNHFIPAN